MFYKQKQFYIKVLQEFNNHNTIKILQLQEYCSNTTSNVKFTHALTQLYGVWGALEHPQKIQKSFITQKFWLSRTAAYIYNNCFNCYCNNNIVAYIAEKIAEQKSIIILIQGRFKNFVLVESQPFGRSQRAEYFLQLIVILVQQNAIVFLKFFCNVFLCNVFSEKRLQVCFSRFYNNVHKISDTDITNKILIVVDTDIADVTDISRYFLGSYRYIVLKFSDTFQY
eukprot:TRINITY_DN640_c0_g3_i2.p1 TRINITY_DN640_c0_g3~~TRINITY_DN640_c0_g3_i2.p1  ORF type:complete len:225 (-),score=0.92 TRINITY_DN640_c0_g3_i2:577-1251(-)